MGKTTRGCKRAFYLGLSLGLLVELASALPFVVWRPFVEDSYRALSSPMVFASPLILLGLSIWKPQEDFSVRLVDVLFGAVSVLSMASFFLIYRGFTPFNPIYTVFSTFVLYLCFRMAWKIWLRPHLSEIFWFVFGLVTVEAAHGVLGESLDLKSDTHLLNKNFLGMLCALTIPLWMCLLRDGACRDQGWRFRILFWTSSALLVSTVYLTNCRTAWVSLILIVPVLVLSAWWPDRLRRLGRWPISLKLGSVAALALAMVPLAWTLYQIRPVSAQGRLLIWRVSLSIFSDYPVLGVGFGQLPHYLGVYHGRFFEEGTATLTERMLPSLFFDSFNEYLRVAVEHGLLGLAFWVPFWVVILLAAWQPIGRASDLAWKSGGRCEPGSPHPLTLGLSGLVLIFMILSFFYFPSDVLIFSVLFVFCLAGLASEDRVRHAARTGGQG